MPETTVEDKSQDSLESNRLKGKVHGKEKQVSKTIGKFSPEDEAEAQFGAMNDLIRNTVPTTELEKALKEALEHKDTHIEKLHSELMKLRAFVSKRKQCYKRKRKDDNAPVRAMSAYNHFIKERFKQLAEQNEQALKSDNPDDELKRVPPHLLVTKVGKEWNDLSAEERAKYEERAKADRKRYEEEMTLYQAPDKAANRKRNKTGYNMFFSAHVLRLKQSESGVPSERGSVARIVGEAWKALSQEEKDYYEREADKHNGMHNVDNAEDEDEEDMYEHHPHGSPGHEMPYPPPMIHHPGIMPHDPRAHPHHPYYPSMYPGPYAHYDYSQHHQRSQGRAGQHQYGYQPAQYDP